MSPKKTVKELRSFWDKGDDAEEQVNKFFEDLVDPQRVESFEDIYGLTENASAADIVETSGAAPVKLTRNPSGNELEKLRSRLVAGGPAYRVPLNDVETEELKSEGKGVIWFAKIVDETFDNPKFFTKEGTLKPRRPLPHIFKEDFFSNLKETSDGRWIFNGNLNDWPSLTNLEVLQLEFWYTKTVAGRKLTYSKRFWKKGENQSEPYFPDAGQGFFKIKPSAIRATLMMPDWSDIGYSKDNPGFVFWYAPFRKGGRLMSHGENIIKAAREDAAKAGVPTPECTAAHFFGHRYAKEKEGPKDLLTWHTGVLLEWDHGQFTTVVELAYLFGLGGYGGKSNWVEDRDEPLPALYEAMPAALKAPWRTDRSEIRIVDHPAKNVDEFMAYMRKYEGPTKRFLDPEIKHSGKVSVAMRSQDAIWRYVLNYSIRDVTYTEEFHNCQSFAADFYGFLVDDKDAEPYQPIKILYTPRRDLFLYEPTNYEDNKGLKWIDTEKILARTKDVTNYMPGTPDLGMKTMIAESGESLRDIFQKGVESLLTGSNRFKAL